MTAAVIMELAQESKLSLDDPVSKMGYDPTNQVTLVVWTNLAVAPDGQQPANILMLNVFDQIYEVSPLSPPPSPTATP